MCRNLCTDSVHLQPQGYIFQYGFLGEVQFKKSIKKGLFDQKMGFYSQKKQKNFENGVRLYSRVGLYTSGYGI